jgi:hypothetical protein
MRAGCEHQERILCLPWHHLQLKKKDAPVSISHTWGSNEGSILQKAIIVPSTLSSLFNLFCSWGTVHSLYLSNVRLNLGTSAFREVERY